LARARVHDPQVLLLDEPFTGLDRPAGDGFAARLADLRNAGRSVLLVTHNLARAAELADSFQLLRAGRCAFHQREPLPGRTAVEALYREHAEGGA
jgi:ABC-type multidrug transport system ATPase subunit